MRNSIKNIIVLLNILMIILAPLSPVLAANDNGNGRGNDGGNSGGNGGGNGGGNNAGGNSGKDGADKGNNGNGGADSDKTGNGENKKINKDAKSGGNDNKNKQAKADRKSARESKLKNILEKNENTDHINKSKDNLKNLLFDIPITDETPYVLKQQSYETISLLQGDGEEARRLEKITGLMIQTLNRSLWLDDRHILYQEVFNYDMHAAQDIKVLVDREKKSSLPQDDLIYSFIKLIQSDKMLAYIGIQDMEKIVERMPYEDSAEFEWHLDKAINHFEKAEDLIGKGSYVPAVQHYGNAWNESFGFLIEKGAVLPPQVFIEEPAEGSYTNKSDQRVAGLVFDLMVFFMTSVNITMDGTTWLAPLVNGSFEHNVTLKENLNTIEVSTVNYFGNMGSARVNVTLDTILPVITITGVEEGVYYARNVSASVEFIDLHISQTEVLLDGKPYISGVNISSEGRHTLAARAADLAGNTAYKAVNFIIDTTQPEVRIIYPTNGTFVRQTVSIDGNASDINLDSVTLSVDGVKVSGSSDFAWDTTAYQDGAHTITLEALDKAGNSASTSVDVRVDNTLPEVAIKSPLNFYLRQNIAIDADVTDANLESITVRMDGSEISTVLPYELDTSLYPDGNHTIEIYGIDKAGNLGGKGVKVNFDNTAPEINITSPLNGSFVKHAVEITGIVNDPNLLAYVITVDGNAVSNSLPYLWDSFAYSDGNHTIRIDAADRAGNTASKEITVRLDNTLPDVRINFPPDGAFIRGVIDLTVDVFDANLDKFQIFINGVLVAENRTNFRWNTSEYPDGAYRIEVVAYDLAGNEMRKSINVTVDNTPPLLIVNELTDNPTLKYPAYRLNGTVEPEALLVINGTTVSHSSSFEYTMNLTEGTNVITVITTDRAGNTASWTKTRLVDADDLPDYYEINVTGTDPLDGDSDSGKTPENEADNGILDHIEDFDGDGLANYAEYKVKSNPFMADTDNDSLDDLYELLATGTSLLRPDTDDNGIRDADEDLDKDGLTNLEEQALRTNPINPDTDVDNLSDKDEVNLYQTNPLNRDTDEDRLTDGLEIALGADPLISDIDGDGIPDGKDSFNQQFANATLGASIQILGSGDLQNTLEIRKDASPYVPVTRLSGIVSDFIEYNTSSTFESAKVWIYYNESMLNGSVESNLKLYYFDEATNLPVEAPGQLQDTVSNYIEATTNHLSMWFIADNSYWATQSSVQWNHPDVIYSVGDKINLKAQVHNTGDAAVTGDVLVYFYEGNPDAGGRYIGSATITGGIAQGGAKTAVYYGYTLLSSSVDIYVKVDPLNSIPEKNEETNNRAYRTLSIGVQSFDSDGDGLTDAEENDGMQVMYPYRAVRTSPYNPDSDDDGLSDGEEMGSIAYYSNGKPYYSIISYADAADSDNDGLDDFEEVRQAQTIYVADTPAKAQGFLKAVYEGADSSPYLTAVLTTSKPLEADTDGDTILDGEEIIMGTDPDNQDSDNDGIFDNKEREYGEDPTIFDITPPTITVDYMLVSKDPFSFTAKYNFWYTVSDYGGVKDVELLKNDIKRDGYSYTARITTVDEHTYFETTWETIIDALRTARVDINARDWNSNYETALVYHRSSMYGQMAAQLGYDNIFGYGVAEDLGLLSGLSATVAEMPEFVILIGNDPSGFLSSMKDLAGSITSDPALLADLISSLPDSVKEKQELENPYAAGTALRERFANGWYSGYIGTQILSMFVGGGEVLQTVKSSERFAQLTKSLLAKMNEIKALLRASKALRITEKVGAFLLDDAASVGLTGPADILGKIKTAAKQANVVKHLRSIGNTKLKALEGYHGELSELLVRTGDDGVGFVMNMDDATLRNMFSLSVRGADSRLMGKLRANLVRLNTRGVSSGEIEKFIGNTDKLKGVNGIDRAVSRVSTAGDTGNFKGVAFEVEYAASRNVDDIIEMGADSGVGQLGEIDLIMREGTKKVGYELKNIDYAEWTKYQNKFANENAGFKELLQKGTINDYKLMFKGRPPADMISWLNSKNIPWDFV